MKALIPFLLLAPCLWGAPKPEYTAYRLDNQHPLTMDGNLSDWPDNLPILLLGQEDQVVSGSWGGPSDSHAKVRITWDDQKLYMAIEEVDDVIIQDASRARAHTIHGQDAFQWAVDISGDGGEGYGDDNYEYGFSLVEGEPLAYRWYSSSGWPKGIAEHIDMAIVENPQGGQIYEAAIDWSMLAPLRNPEDGRVIGFTILLQDRDKTERKTLGWTPGVATGKNPDAFGKLIFSRATPSADGSGLLLSASDTVGTSGMDVRIIPTGADHVEGDILYQVVLEDGTELEAQPLTPVDDVGSAYTATVPSRDMPAGKHMLLILDDEGKTLARHGFTRSDTERLQWLIEEIGIKTEELEELIAEADTKGIQTRYPLSVLTAAKMFKGYIQEDTDNKLYELALHNAEAIDQALTDAENDLLTWMQSPDGMPKGMLVPDFNYADTQIDGRHFVIDGQPVMLVGPLAWMWGVRSDIAKMGDMGYNYVIIGWDASHQFKPDGSMKPMSDIPYWAVKDIQKVATEKKMAVSNSMVPEDIWKVLERRDGEQTVDKFHEVFDMYARKQIHAIGKGKTFDYNISVEGQRPHVNYEPEHHQEIWVAYLEENYPGGIAELNGLYGTKYSSFEEVAFPTSLPENPAQKYDYTRMRQIMIANELSRAADQIRENDPGAYVRGYPYVWTFRDAGAYYHHAIDPELDMANWDIAGCDTSGPYQNDRYAMSTINWMPGYYDLMRSLAGDRPLCDGEYHYVNRRRIYPDNWARAIYYQSYMHGLDATISWVWVRGNMDTSLLLDANVLLGSGQVALDLQRTAPAVAAFQDMPNNVVLMYSNASSPHSSRASDGTTLSQMTQTDRAYEGMFFDGMQIGYVSETMAQDGALDDQKVLVVPNCSHVYPATRQAIIDFAQKGGQVVLLGDSLLYTPQGAPLEPMPDLPTITTFKNGFRDGDQARQALQPILKKAGVLPDIDIQFENGREYPTVEWKHATDADGNEMLFVLNLGYDPASVTMPKGWDDAYDLLACETPGGSFDLDSLEFRVLKKQQ